MTSSWSPRVLVGLGVAALCGCATITHQPSRPETPLREDTGSSLRAQPLHFDALTRADVERVLEEWPDSPLNDALRAAIIRDAGIPHRLATQSGPTPLLTDLLRGAQALTDVGLDLQELDVAMVQAQAEALTLKKMAHEAGDGAGAHGEITPEEVHELEVLGWRLALQIASDLGGVLADTAYLARLPESLSRFGVAAFAPLMPNDTTYKALLAARTRFQGLLDATKGKETVLPEDDGWYPTLYGTKKPRILALRQRLSEHGLDAPPVSDMRSFDSSIERQLAVFQEQHGLEATGRPDTETAIALNVGLADRLSEIDDALRQWRQDPLRDVASRLVLNLPSFTLRRYEGGDVTDTFRVIVGSNNIDIDPFIGKRGHLNRTPTLDTEVVQVVLNPSWVVPRRIKELVLDPLADQDPRRYDDFELSVGATGVERAVQRPGPRNAMGQVKFVLASSPIVLHDTPGRRQFKQRVRALSHGDVRVDAARDLAKKLLEADGHTVTPTTFDRVLRTRHETFVTLRRPVPLSIQYRTVEIDTKGKIRFHPDIYGTRGNASSKQGRATALSLR